MEDNNSIAKLSNSFSNEFSTLTHARKALLEAEMLEEGALQ